MASRRNTVRIAATLATVGVLVLSACAPGSDKDDTSGSGPITIGASLPLSGALAGFGSFQDWGYKRAVKEANDAGGIEIDGTKRKVTLKIVDDKTDPNQVTANIKSLISRDDSVGLLGSCTPDLVNPGAVVADQQKVPFVAGCDPIEIFSGVKKWTYAWDIFFSVPELSALSFDTLDGLGLESNKRVAILHDNGPDGKAVGNGIWPGLAKKAGYNVVANVEFPTDNTDFSASIQQAKAADADILLVDCVTPQAISLRKQMAAVGYEPKYMVNEKGAEPVQYSQALGTLAGGVLVGAYWDSTFPYPGAADLQKAFQSETGKTSSQHIADSYTAAKVLLDAIASAGSTDPKKINDAIGKTDKTYVVGPVRFTGNNVAKINVAMSQWQNGKPVIVYPKARQTGSILFPLGSK